VSSELEGSYNEQKFWRAWNQRSKYHESIAQCQMSVAMDDNKEMVEGGISIKLPFEEAMGDTWCI
jgi:hypothetical protein